MESRNKHHESQIGLEQPTGHKSHKSYQIDTVKALVTKCRASNSEMLLTVILMGRQDKQIRAQPLQSYFFHFFLFAILPNFSRQETYTMEILPEVP